MVATTLLNLAQDAQEFSKLLMQKLESSCGEDSSLSRCIKQLFRGTYSYVTKCLQCDSVTENPSSFYELDLSIQGMSSLPQCLDKFLEPEDLVDDNKYMCSVCAEKTSGQRWIQLRELPNFLNLQLLRFVFDMKKLRKQKLHNTIQFPFILDVSPYLNAPENTHVYSLAAILIHRGQSPNSGHYMAQIKNRSEKKWYLFSDESITEVKRLQLGDANDDKDLKNGKQKTDKESCASRTAYMLVYQRGVDSSLERLANTEATVEDAGSEAMAELPDFLKRYVIDENQSFEEHIMAVSQAMMEEIGRKEAKHETMQGLVSRLLPDHVGSNAEFVCSKWLKHWLTGDEVTETCEHLKFLCPHAKMSLDRVSDVKCISSVVAEFLHDNFTLGPRFSIPDSFCKECVSARARLIRLQHELGNDYRAVCNRLKRLKHCNEGVWVDSTSLKSWKKWALERFDQEQEANGESISLNDNENNNLEEMNGTGDKGTTNGAYIADDPFEIRPEDFPEENGTQTGSNRNQNCCVPSPPDSDQSLTTNFNSRVYCEHGKLSANLKGCRLIPEDLWGTISKYFPNAKTFSHADPVCATCEKVFNQSIDEHEQICTLAFNQRFALSDLLRDRNRPDLGIGDSHAAFLISREFVNKWKQFVRNPSATKKENLVFGDWKVECEHGLLTHQGWDILFGIPHEIAEI